MHFLTSYDSVQTLLSSVLVRINASGIFIEEQGASIISCRGGSANSNSWAELDLNQRRHIANEFTVRPH